MGRNINQVLLGELENLEKDPEKRRDAMKALKSYVKDLDSKGIPIFLARASEIKDPSSSSGECVISLFDILVRSHGRNIVPHIDNIMGIIIKALSSSAGSFSLHQSCSKVVSSIARYGIDPLMSETEKARIISSLCKPLSNVLMGSQESFASGAALCLRALVESDNWRFASDATVNEVCLKVAGALEEARTQTTSHMALVMALLQHNALIIDAYARSLIRSGLQILTANVKEKNSQKRLSSVQMINFLMKCVDSRSISSEIDKIADIMENCQNDHMPFVRGAAFEAWETAKIVAGQKGSWHEVRSSPVVGSNSPGIIDRNFPQVGKCDCEDSENCGALTESSPHESSTVDCSADNGSIFGSPLSLGQSSCNVEHDRCATRRLWNNGTSSFDAPLENGLCYQSGSSSNGSTVRFTRFRNGELSDTLAEHLEALSGSIPPSARNICVRSATTSPQRSRPQLDNAKMYSTPQKLNRSLQTPSNANFESHGRHHFRMTMSPGSVEVEQNSILNRAEARVNGSMRRMNNLQGTLEAEHAMHGTELPSSDRANDKVVSVQMAKEERSRRGKAFVGFVCFFFTFVIAVILSYVWFDNDEVFSGVVPT